MGNAILAPNLKWYVVTACGTPAVNGYILTFDNNTGLPRPTYADPGKLTPNPLRLNLGPDGAYSGPLYWDLDPGLYFIEVYDGSGTLLETQYNYPTVNPGTGGNIINITTNAVNYVPNPQMYFWNDGTSFDNTTLPIGTTRTADDWTFTRTNLDADVTISQEFFAAGVNLAPGTPPCYMRYEVTIPGADTENDWGFTITNVQSLNNLQVTAYFWGASLVILQSIQISLVCVQYFGTGGSPTITTVVDTYTLNDTFAAYSTTFTVPSISGLTIGTGSYIGFYWRFDPAVSQIAGVTDFRLQQGSGTGPVWPYQTLDEQYANILPFELLGTSDTQGANIVTFCEGEPGDLISVKQAIVNAAPALSNLLYCPYMPTNPNQYGKVVDSTTIVQNNDGNYIADGVILQSDGDNIVYKNSFSGGIGDNNLDLYVVQTGKKFGIAQIASSSTTGKFVWSTGLYNSIVSAFVRVSVVTSVSPTFKIALIGWSGTVDLPTKKIVSNWEAPGTNPTLSAGWSYLGVSDSFTLLTNDLTPLLLEGVDLNDIYQNVAIFCWVDSGDMLPGDKFVLTEWGVNQGYTAFQPFRPTQQESIKQAEYFLRKSYDKDDPLAWGYANNRESLNLPCTIGRTLYIPDPTGFPYATNIGAISPCSSDSFSGIEPFNLITSQFYTSIELGQMARIPDVTFYNPSISFPTVDPNFNTAYLYNSLVSNFYIPISVDTVSPNRITSFCSSVTQTFTPPVTFSNLGVFVNYVADATIGV